VSRIGLLADTASVSTGAESGSNFSTVGCSMVFGSSGSTRLTRSRTSCAPMSASFSRRNATITCDTPSDDVERSSSMPLMVLTASSILSVISVSTSSGAAPGRRVVTTTVGKSTLGKRSRPRRPNENAPTTVSERMMTVAKTGRLTEIEASHCINHNLRIRETSRRMNGETGERPRAPGELPAADEHAVGDPATRLGHDELTVLETGDHLDPGVHLFAERHDPLIGLAVLHDVDTAGAADGLDGGRGDGQRRRRLALLNQRGRKQAG